MKAHRDTRMSGQSKKTDGQDRTGGGGGGGRATRSERGIHTGVAVRVMLMNLTAISTGFWKEGRRKKEGGRTDQG